MQCTNCTTFQRATICVDKIGRRNAKNMLQKFEKLLRTVGSLFHVLHRNTVSWPDGQAMFSIELRKKCTPHAGFDDPVYKLEEAIDMAHRAAIQELHHVEAFVVVEVLHLSVLLAE